MQAVARDPSWLYPALLSLYAAYDLPGPELRQRWLNRDRPAEKKKDDAPVVPADIMRLLEIAVERRTRTGFVLGEDQRISVEEALHAVTLGAAYAYFEEDTKGSISVGKQADLVVLAADPRTVPSEEISEIEILETYARGRNIHSATPQVRSGE